MLPNVRGHYFDLNLIIKLLQGEYNSALVPATT